MPFYENIKNISHNADVLSEDNIMPWYKGFGDLVWVETLDCPCPEHERVSLAIYEDGAVLSVEGRSIKMSLAALARIAEVVMESSQDLHDRDMKADPLQKTQQYFGVILHRMFDAGPNKLYGEGPRGKRFTAEEVNDTIIITINNRRYRIMAEDITQIASVGAYFASRAAAAIRKAHDLYRGLHGLFGGLFGGGEDNPYE